MSDPERRRRRLFLGQLAVGLLAAPVGMLFVAIVVQPFGAGWAFVAVVVSAVLIAPVIWALIALERAKFATAAVPHVDWSEELRSVRDSRRVIVAAFEIERRRIERDLHDGTQQYLVAATIKLGEASHFLKKTAGDPGAHASVAGLIEGAHQDAEMALRSLRSTVSGIHPQMLTDLGLRAAVTDMAQRSGLNIIVRCPHPLPNMPEEIAAVAWFFCSEAITNIIKHAPDASATVLLAADQDLHVSIVDDGPGGAHFRDGGGLAGMRERLAAFGASMELTSLSGGPTTLAARIPLLLAPASEDGKNS